jgi:biotin synthase
MSQSSILNPTLNSEGAALRHNWQINEIRALYQLPFNDLLFKAHSIHRETQVANQVQISTLMSIKTGACPEDCKYCSQSAHHNTGLEKEKFLEVQAVLDDANRAKAAGASRFCMGAAWRSPTKKDWPQVLEMVKGVKSLGMETCMTLGMLNENQAKDLADAGLDYYNHNLDTSKAYYKEIITTRNYQDRLDTLSNVREVGMKVCCGGIIGMGESEDDRLGLLMELANLPEHPESVPINMLVKIKGTPLENTEALDDFDFIRTIAVARIMMPHSFVRLSAGRESMNEQTQALCYFAGANSIFYGEKLLTTVNADANSDMALLNKLGIKPLEIEVPKKEEHLETNLMDSIVANKESHLYYDAASKNS